MDWAALVSMLGLGLVAGAIGSMLGIGGGVFVVPFLSVAMKLPIQAAIGTSTLAMIANSNASTAVYSKSRLANARLGMLLESTTIVGAVAGALLAVSAPERLLNLLFAAFLLFMSFEMGLRRRPAPAAESTAAEPEGDSALAGSYRDGAGKTVRYGARRIPFGLGVNVLVGGIAGLLGVGGGIVRVPVLTLVMGVPMQAAVATSAFVLGLTGASSAMVFLGKGLLYPLIIAPVAIGVFAGSQLGTRLAQRISGPALRRTFAVVLLLTAAPMVLQALNVGLPW